MKLGIFNCVVVSSEKDLREVLITKGDHFDGRPDWRRFDLMFGGTRRNGGFLYQHNLSYDEYLFQPLPFVTLINSKLQGGRF